MHFHLPNGWVYIDNVNPCLWMATRGSKLAWVSWHICNSYMKGLYYYNTPYKMMFEVDSLQLNPITKVLEFLLLPINIPRPFSTFSLSYRWVYVGLHHKSANVARDLQCSCKLIHQRQRNASENNYYVDWGANSFQSHFIGLIWDLWCLSNLQKCL